MLSVRFTDDEKLKRRERVADQHIQMQSQGGMASIF